MTERDTGTSKPYLSWKAMASTVLAMVGTTALALLLIEQLSLRAAIRGATISIGVFVAVQIAQRIAFSRRRQ